MANFQNPELKWSVKIADPRYSASFTCLYHFFVHFLVLITFRGGGGFKT